MNVRYLVLLLLLVNIAVASEVGSSGYRILNKVLQQCDKSADILRCLKIQTLKVFERASRMDSFKIIDGLSIVKDDNARSMQDNEMVLTEEKLHNLESNQIDGMLVETTDTFLKTHKVQLDIPKFVEEARGKMKKYMMPMMAVMAVKGGMLAMMMKGVTMMSGMAIMMAKMSLMLSAIMGLKKLLGNGGGQQKTTVEIVKHPRIEYASSYSNSFEDGGGGGGYGGGYGGHGSSGGGGGGYHRSLTDLPDDLQMQEKAYSAHVPKKYS